MKSKYVDKYENVVIRNNQEIGISDYGLDYMVGLEQEIERLNNIIYTTLEYVDRQEVNSIGKPFVYTEIGKDIKKLLEGEKTFDSIWKENKRLNNIINELGKTFKRDLEGILDFEEKHPEAIMTRLPEFYLEKLQELKGSDKE